MRSAASAGSLPAAISARASSGPSASNHSSAIQLRIRVPERRLDGRGLGSAATIGRASRAARRSTAFTSPAPARELLGQLDRLADRRVGGHAVQERELEYAEPERREHGGLEPVDRPAGELLDHVVERRAALDGAVGKPRCERAITRVEPAAPRLAVKRTVGVGALLEYPADDRIRARACGWTPRFAARPASTPIALWHGMGSCPDS